MASLKADYRGMGRNYEYALVGLERKDLRLCRRMTIQQGRRTVRIQLCMIHSEELMTRLRMPSLLLITLFLVLGGCATRPINPPITRADPSAGYRFETRQAQAQVQHKENLVILAFSGGGTRAAAFSYGVLEFLRRTEVVGPQGNTVRLLDAVDVITGVSGGSFTALAYGL